jgi:hypothetical protein
MARWYPPGVRRVENEPRRVAMPREPESTQDQPARARQHVQDRGPTGDEQAPPPTRRRSAAALRLAWVLLLVALSVGLAVLRTTGETLAEPSLLQQWLAVALAVTLAVGLASRSGNPVLLFAALALVVGVGAVGIQWDPLLAGAAVGTGVVAACLAVLGTTPAPTFPRVVLEVVVALFVATAGGLGAGGFAVDLDTERFAYTVLALAMVATVALVYRLGGGLHGLGRRGLILAAGALVLLLVVLVYTAALTRYGSPGLIEQVRSAEDWTRDHLGGVPHPVEVLIGIPALAWGVSLRSRRRQGWWVCAFGVAATAASASRLVDDGLAERATALAAVYSILLGLLLGLVVIRLERLLTGRGGRHARGEQLARHEPGRLQPLH